MVALKNLLQDMYVDDVATSFQNIEECLEFYFKSKNFLKVGGFEFRKWNSNNKKLMDKTCVEDNKS